MSLLFTLVIGIEPSVTIWVMIVSKLVDLCFPLCTTFTSSNVVQWHQSLLIIKAHLSFQMLGSLHN